QPDNGQRLADGGKRMAESRTRKAASGKRKAAAPLDPALLRRVIIEAVTPQVDDGRYPAKRTAGETVVVEADVYADGHDVLAARLLWRRRGEKTWRETPMEALPNDRWRASFAAAEEFATYEFTVEGWVDTYATWKQGLEKKLAAGQDVTSERLEERLLPADAGRSAATRYPRVLTVIAERERARFGAWYEMFPRSAGSDPSRSATFAEAAERLPYIAAMGFDVVYLPPIHPIGTSFRKGRNNSLAAGPGDPGSPWAIGSAEGGHTAIEPGLGTLADFGRFVAAARARRLEIALDLAFQASPDHPYVTQHPEWFRHRPDGTIKYAENPPKKYQDIYPFDFASADWEALWRELKGVIEFWIAQGVTIFRVDNPHTKPFAFWEWALGDIRAAHPETIFLAEAFTRPKIMRHLAKIGFSQSYSYFTWRNTKEELEEYFTELTQTEVREYMRPNLFANTPDILHAYLQHGGPAAFKARFVLAATLGANYGIYSGFELYENVPVRPGSEEYLDSEKYQIRPRTFDAPGSMSELIARVNAIRREHRALQFDHGLRFHETDNPQLICYSKRTPPDAVDPILVVVNLDPFNMQHGYIKLPLVEWGLPPDASVQAADLLSNEIYTWRGEWNYVRLDPRISVAHVVALQPIVEPPAYR
ncbi:MAG TPA: alpha-1,4-glucan--maltose-1-phosphate maltosyltransferase, partial [Vicinamibacterales bacterium]|nr:alpha-1,4-glucan--maltose-1-phosphate maltosyltransferase [Vicinamibacterales bacterium]